jgi:curli biogenesis system outer membrane secretion channel CsgG
MSIRSFLVIAGLAFAGAAQAQPQTVASWTGPKLRIAVMNLSGTALKMQQLTSPTAISTTVAIPPPAEFALGLTEMLTTSLAATGRFIVLERASIEQIKAEQDLGEANRANKETAAAIGNITGAQYHITGDITEFSYSRSTLAGNLKILKSTKTSGERVTAMVALDIRLVDAVTSEVTWSKRFQGKATMTGMAAQYAKEEREVGLGGSKATPLGAASRQAIEGAVAAIVAGLKVVPWTGRIIDVRDGRIYVNAGSELGIKPGMQFDVFDQQEKLLDPETGRSLGAPETKTGTIVVETVEEKYSLAKGVTGTGFKRNQLLKLKGAGGNP